MKQCRLSSNIPAPRENAHVPISHDSMQLTFYAAIWFTVIYDSFPIKISYVELRPVWPMRTGILWDTRTMRPLSCLHPLQPLVDVHSARLHAECTLHRPRKRGLWLCTPMVYVTQRQCPSILRRRQSFLYKRSIISKLQLIRSLSRLQLYSAISLPPWTVNTITVISTLVTVIHLWFLLSLDSIFHLPNTYHKDIYNSGEELCRIV